MTNNTSIDIFENSIADADKLDQFILEGINKTIPLSIKEFYKKKQNRNVILQKYGKEAFLQPKSLKFPIINPETGEKDCRLVYAAYIRANQWSNKKSEYKEIANKAKKIYDEMKCSNKIDVNLHDSEDTSTTVDLSLFVSTFECSSGETD